MSIARIFGLSPVNRTAALVTLQRGVAQEDGPMGKDELMGLMKPMERKSRLLKRVLKIDTPAQHKNATRRFKNGKGSKFRDSRALSEYVRLGDQMQVFIVRLSEIKGTNPQKSERRLLAQQEQAAREKEGVDTQLVKQILKRDSYRCLTCRLPSMPGQRLLAAKIDATRPPAPDNLTTVCLPCWTLENGNEVAA